MCLNPIKIINPTKRISRRGGQKLSLLVQCNHCAECLNRKRDEYSFRTYHHCKDTIDYGGYVIFDTLTYSDEYLPHISDVIDVKKYGIKDFSCFNLEHYKLFFKRLRSAIKERYGVTGAISYLFTSEYGVSEGYTHRPHYHFLLFVKHKFIDPLWVSRKIDECWQYGRTDGINYNSLEYVAKHVYGYNLGYGAQDTIWILRAVTHYVSKYITKSSKFQSQLNKRIDSINIHEFGDEELKSAIKHINQFHRISSGYGLGLFNHLDERDIEAFKTDTCILPDQQKVIKTLPLPTYYIRKLYYECVTGTTGKKVWQLTENGISHYAKLRIQNIVNNEIKLQDLLHNATPEQRANCDKLLNGRTLADYSIYKLFYEGRMRDHYAIDLRKIARYGLVDNEDISNEVWHKRLDECTQANMFDEHEAYYVSDDNKKVEMRNPYFRVISHDYAINRIRKLDKDVFVKMYTFNENSCPEFRNFDKLTKLFDFITKEDKILRQKTYEFNRDYENRMKALNLL